MKKEPKRGRGRPVRSAENSSIMGLRLTTSERATIENAAAIKGVNAADIIRNAAMASAKRIIAAYAAKAGKGEG